MIQTKGVIQPFDIFWGQFGDFHCAKSRFIDAIFIKATIVQNLREKMSFTIKSFLRGKSRCEIGQFGANQEFLNAYRFRKIEQKD